MTKGWRFSPYFHKVFVVVKSSCFFFVFRSKLGAQAWTCDIYFTHFGKHRSNRNDQIKPWCPPSQKNGNLEKRQPGETHSFFLLMVAGTYLENICKSGLDHHFCKSRPKKYKIFETTIVLMPKNHYVGGDRKFRSLLTEDWPIPKAKSEGFNSTIKDGPFTRPYFLGGLGTKGVGCLFFHSC